MERDNSTGRATTLMVSTNESEAVATQDPRRRRFSAAFKIIIYNELAREGGNNSCSYMEPLRRRDAQASLAGRMKALKAVTMKTASGITVILRPLRINLLCRLSSAPPLASATTTLSKASPSSSVQ